MQGQRKTIRFGTDGWRAIIADSFTFENVRIIAQAIGDHLNERNEGDAGVAISHDARFLSHRFARLLAEVISSHRIPVFLSRSHTPTPILSHAVKNRRLTGGVMVTASHNPYEYNGVKFKGSYGGPAMTELTKAIEGQLYRHPPRTDAAAIKKYLQEVDFYPEYAAQLNRFLRFDIIDRFTGSVVLDPMHAAGCGYIDSLLADTRIPLRLIHGNPDPLFGGLSPEPILKNLTELRQAVLSDGARIGLATDGDADRFGVLDERGEFVELHDLMPLFFDHLKDLRGWTGDAVRTTSMADTIDRAAQEKGLRVHEVPVGFKYVCEKMLTEDILIGGEESGGFGYKNHMPERDGLLSCLLVIEMIAHRGCSIRDLVAELREKYGPFAYGRIDAYHDADVLSRNLSALRDDPPDRVGAFRVASVNLSDGIKLYFEDRSWMLMRVSQTEPMGRIYVGSDENAKVNDILRAGLALLTSNEGVLS